MMIRVLIADDYPVVRKGIADILTTSGDMSVVGEAENGRELSQLANTVEHDIVLLDLSMPHSDPHSLLKQLKRERPRVPVLVVTMYSEGQIAARALKAGAAGYVLKDSSPDEIVGAVRGVLRGARYVSPLVAENLESSLAAIDTPLHERLSDREFQVLRMIASGQSTRAISIELSLSIKTVSTYRSRIFEKMQMKSPAELAAYVVREGLSQ
jgi:DNA-binding NarL/FixJ family response regulator